MELQDADAISFDLDDTLVRYERSPGEVLAVCFDRLDLDPLFPVEAYYARYDEFAERCDSMDELRSECFAALAEDNGYERALGREVAATFSDERDQSNVELLPSVARLLDELADEYGLGVVTNGARDAQRRKVEAVSLDRWVDTVVVAGHDTPPKPDPEPFERVVDALDVTLATTVHIGDSLESDVAGATAAGLASVWISGRTDAQGYDPTARVDSPAGLWPLLLESPPPGERR
jgi:HAD superfamily hydrolase (TIGR01549 family)